MNVVGENNVRVGTDVGTELVVELLGTEVGGLGGVVLVVLAVEVGVDDHVAEGAEVGLAVGLAGEVGGAHVARREAVDAAGGFLDLHHLGLAVGGRDGLEIRVGAGVGADHVALGAHAADGVGVGRRLDVAEVVGVDEEGRLDVVLLQDVEKLGGELERAVVEGECDEAGLDTLGDDLSRSGAAGDWAESVLVSCGSWSVEQGKLWDVRCVCGTGEDGDSRSAQERGSDLHCENGCLC